MPTYGTTVIPSDQITVIAGGTVAVSVAFENSIGLMGGMDTVNGTANTGEVVKVSSPSDAIDKFGEDSELHEQVNLAFQNGAGTIWALPVEETATTESFSNTDGGVLGNVPAKDPNIHGEHSITGDDTSAGNSLDVNIVYNEGNNISTPSASDTININPDTGEWEADASSNYDINYTYGDYSTSAMQPLLDKSPRIVGVCTENESVVNDFATEFNSRATDFGFMHGVAGARPKVADPSSYSDGVDEERISLCYPSRGYTDSAGTNEVRSMGAVGGHLASLPLGLSSTNDSVGGLQSFRTPLQGPSEAGTMIDAQVMPLLDYPPTTIIKDMTTSTEPKFERVYAMQVIDEASELTHIIARNFVGDQNTVSTRATFKRSLANMLISMEDDTPPLLDDYTVTVTENASDPNQVDVEIGLDVVDIMDTIDVTIVVGDIIRNAGAT